MEGNGLFNPGFLGANFLWWVGQIADDSTWRDNISSGKFTNGQSIAGWGRRYKVRIVGLHDKGLLFAGYLEATASDDGPQCSPRHLLRGIGDLHQSRFRTRAHGHHSLKS